MLFYTTFVRRTFTVSLNELFENYTGRHTHVYSVRMSRLKYPPRMDTLSFLLSLFGKSAIKILNSRGLNIQPCLTPFPTSIP